jgi:large conductance mechanosensitive channel
MATDAEVLEELKKIREALAPTPPPAEPEKKKNLLHEFKDFIMKYKVLGLAVAFIMGIYLGALVQSLVDNLIMPIVEFFTPAGFQWEVFVVGPFRVGAFIGDLITFIIVAFVIFLLVKYTAKLGIE